MLTTIRRYLCAFVIAQLAAWWEQTVKLIGVIERTAQANQVDAAALKVHVDKRDLSMATILATVKFHAEREYPYLLANHEQYDQMTIQALNLNDRYLILRLAESVNPPLKAPVDALSEHLQQPPLQIS
jgi:hypothetical protein